MKSVIYTHQEVKSSNWNKHVQNAIEGYISNHKAKCVPFESAIEKGVRAIIVLTNGAKNSVRDIPIDNIYFPKDVLIVSCNCPAKTEVHKALRETHNRIYPRESKISFCTINEWTNYIDKRRNEVFSDIYHAIEDELSGLLITDFKLTTILNGVLCGYPICCIVDNVERIMSNEQCSDKLHVGGRLVGMTPCEECVRSTPEQLFEKINRERIPELGSIQTGDTSCLYSKLDVTELMQRENVRSRVISVIQLLCKRLYRN